MPYRTGIAVSIFGCVITDAAFKPRSSFRLKGNAQGKHHIPVNVHIGARVHLILHSTNVCAIGNTGKVIVLCIVVLGNVNGVHGINLFKCGVARIAERVIAVAALYNVKKGRSVLPLQVVLGVKAVGLSLGAYIKRVPIKK